MAGLTATGLEIKRLDQIREDLRKEATAIFSDLVTEDEVLDTSSASTVGRLIGLVTLSEADLWETIQQVYSSFDPNSASGIALDNLVALSGIVRRGATSSTARLLLTGAFSTTIPAGSLVSSSFTNNRFEIPTDVVLDQNNVVGFSTKIQTVIDSTDYTITYNDGTNSVDLTYTSGVGATDIAILNGLKDTVNDNYGSVLTATVTGAVLNIIADDLVTQTSYTVSGELFFSTITKGITSQATVAGPIEQNTGTIDSISTPVFGWNSINQFESASSGSLRETDSELRTRFSGSKFVRGANIIEALTSDLRGLSGVSDVIIYENLTTSVDAKGIPPHAFMVLIRGGLESEIAEVIWSNRPAGITTFGNSTYLITDIFDNQKEVNYQRPTFQDIYISLEVQTDSSFPPNGAEQLRSALFDYIKSQSTVGQDVVYSRLYTPINSIPGHEVNSLFIGDSASPSGTSNVVVDFDQVAKIEIGNIEVVLA